VEILIRVPLLVRNNKRNLSITKGVVLMSKVKYNPENFDLALFFEKVAKREAKKKRKKNRRTFKCQNQ
jgi:hypothetical protein